MNNKKHLVWIQLEFGGKLLNNYQTIKKEIYKLDFRFVEFSDMICSAPSTVMSTIGMLTGVQPVFLASDHVAKSKQINSDP